MRTPLLLLGAAMAWTIHFNVSYALVALGCAGVVAQPGLWVSIATVGCAVAAVASGVLAIRVWRAVRRHEPRVAGSAATAPIERAPTEGQVFLASIGALSAAVFTLAIVLEGVVPAFLPYCPPSG